MREKFYRFMQGRYGNDQFNQFLMIVALILMVISFFGPNIFYMLALGVIIYAYYRMLSRKIYARAAENQWYLRKSAGVRGKIASKRRMLADRKTHRIYKCPQCRQKIRVPKGHGRIEIRCRKCGATFIRKS